MGNLEAVLGLLLMPSAVPMLHPRYWQQGVLAGVGFAFGVFLIVDGIRRVIRSERP